MPPDVHPIYRPLPLLLRACVWFLAAFASVGWTAGCNSGSWKHPQEIARWSVQKIVSCVVKAVIMGLFTSTVLQELLRPPTRISTVELKKRYNLLPSKLSRFENIKISIPSSSTTEELGVHYLYYDRNSNVAAKNKTDKKPAQPSSHRFQALYVNHGFGASSLSWLPVLPRMVDRLRAKVGVGHDAVGFGFTDRPSSGNNKHANPHPTTTLQQRLAPYSTDGSSAIGTALLQRAVIDNDDDKDDDDKRESDNDKDENKPVILMGHSMGALATLKMALALPQSTRKWIILVAPALGMRPNRSTNSSASKSFFPARIKETFIRGASVVGRYTLRRVVG